MGGKIITVGILISVFGAINGYLLTGPRILYTLGQQKSIPGYRYFGTYTFFIIAWFDHGYNLCFICFIWAI